MLEVYSSMLALDASDKYSGSQTVFSFQPHESIWPSATSSLTSLLSKRCAAGFVKGNLNSKFYAENGRIYRANSKLCLCYENDVLI